MNLRIRIPDLAEYRRVMTAWVIYLAVLLATALIWHQVQRVRNADAEIRFQAMAKEQREVLLDRMHDYEQVLLGATGLFAASVSVERDEWRAYVNSLRLHQTLPGIQGVGYAVMVPRKDKAAHEAKIRAEGFPAYAIYPPGDREMYSSIVYLEPFTGRNLRAFSYDMYSEPVRHKAMVHAAETGNPAWSGKVTLVQEDGQGKQQPGFLVYSPIYAKNKPLNTPAERQAAALGFVYSPFRAWDLLETLYQAPGRLFELQLYDGAVAAANLLYETAPPDPNARFIVDELIEIGGAQWTARFSSNANFDAVVFGKLPLALLLAIVALETLVFGTFLLDTRNRRNLLQSSHNLEQTNREMRLLAKLTENLQSCNSEDEAVSVIGPVMAELFPATSGGCYLLSNSETQLQITARWGDAVDTLAGFFAPDECWAYRRGQLHVVGKMHDVEVRCEHVDEGVPEYACAPMLAQGKVIGDLYLVDGAPQGAESHFAHYVDMLASVADTVSLSISNLRLRSSLRDMAIRDALTGLYNRRYMEETLEREVDRAQRQQHPVAVVMLDVDHFKNMNDSCGHDSGDLVLRRLAEQFRRFRRGIDVICRYGGEEFLIIMPEITRSVLHDRLESLRRDIEAMRVMLEGKELPPITISMGVAYYPDDSTRPDELVRLADVALYRAKQNGRNRIEWVSTADAGSPPA